VQQVQLPLAFGQFHAQPEHGVDQRRLAEMGQHADASRLPAGAIAQRNQGLARVLMGVPHSCWSLLDSGSSRR
jgi:hypothetical protein